MFVPRHPSASVPRSASSPARAFALQPVLVRLAFDGGATVAASGAPLRARSAVLGVLARTARSPPHGTDARRAVRARPDDLRPRDRPLLRLARADRRLARVAADVQLPGARRRRRGAAAPRARRAAARWRSSSRSRVSRSCSPAASAARSTRSGSASPWPPRSPTRPTCSSRIFCSARPSRLVLATMLCAGRRLPSRSAARRPARWASAARRLAAVVGAIALARRSCRSPPSSPAFGDRALAGDDPRHGRAADDDRALGARLRRAPRPLQLLGAGLVVGGRRDPAAAAEARAPPGAAAGAEPAPDPLPATERIAA